jgi:methanogenic corrinoid protein MtbC1
MATLRRDVVERTSWQDGARSRVRLQPRERSRAFESCDLGGDQIGALARAIQAEVVPRLQLARNGQARIEPGRQSGPSPDSAEVEEFANLVPGSDERPPSAFIERMRLRGMSLETVYLKLFAPAARWLGTSWEADRLTFSEVTLGLWRLHQLVRNLSLDFHNEVKHPINGQQVLLLPAPGEHHTFGLLIVAEFFRRSGWNVSSGPFASEAEIARTTRGDWFSIVGFSVSRDDQIDAVASGIRAVRSASRNRAVGILVGGRVFVEHPEFVQRVGADATAVDGRVAVLQAQNLVAMRRE